MKNATLLATLVASTIFSVNGYSWDWKTVKKIQSVEIELKSDDLAFKADIDGMSSSIVYKVYASGSSEVRINRVLSLLLTAKSTGSRVEIHTQNITGSTVVYEVKSVRMLD